MLMQAFVPKDSWCRVRGFTRLTANELPTDVLRRVKALLRSLECRAQVKWRARASGQESSNLSVVESKAACSDSSSTLPPFSLGFSYGN